MMSSKKIFIVPVLAAGILGAGLLASPTSAEAWRGDCYGPRGGYDCPGYGPMKAEAMDTATIAAGTTAGGTATAPGTAREATTVATTTAAGAKATLPTSPPSSARPT